MSEKLRLIPQLREHQMPLRVQFARATHAMTAESPKARIFMLAYPSTQLLHKREHVICKKRNRDGGHLASHILQLHKL
ncbi:hypothetical protein BHM03_00000337 [Ensete ventricosum]|nr:hypothetical protein BHM03_00000337 [Ensete ventricosum]